MQGVVAKSSLTQRTRRHRGHRENDDQLCRQRSADATTSSCTRVIVELKSVETLTALHHAQLLTYMKVSRAEIGLLINFNVPRLIDGVKRFRI